MAFIKGSEPRMKNYTQSYIGLKWTNLQKSHSRTCLFLSSRSLHSQKAHLQEWYEYNDIVILNNRMVVVLSMASAQISTSRSFGRSTSSPRKIKYRRTTPPEHSQRLVFLALIPPGLEALICEFSFSIVLDKVTVSVLVQTWFFRWRVFRFERSLQVNE